MTRTNFCWQYENITMVRGDTLAFNAEIFDENGDPVTVDSAQFTCKKNPLGSETVFHKTLGSGITQSDGMLTVRIAPEDTKEADAGEYMYDFQIGIDHDIYTIKLGTLSILQDVTF